MNREAVGLVMIVVALLPFSVLQEIEIEAVYYFMVTVQFFAFCDGQLFEWPRFDSVFGS